MSGGELAVVLACVALVVAVAVLGAVGVGISRSLKELRRLLGEIRRDLLPAVRRIEEASGRVTGEVQRVGGLLDVAEAVSERADSLSRATHRALVEPLAAAASLFRRAAPSRPAAGDEPPPTGSGGGSAAEPPRPSRRAPWARRGATYLLRAGYRAVSGLAAARLAAAQVQLRCAAARLAAGEIQLRGTAARSDRRGATTRGGGDAGVDAAAAAADRGTAAGPPTASARQLVESIREVTREISVALEEGRQALRTARRTGGRPE
ncbi:MAG: hypothetical protein OXG52_06560 [bacterium]|nr:hypothetical protein [bacterium]